MSTEIAVHRPLVKASTELSQYLGMEVSAMIDTIKSQCFKGKRADEITDAQLATYISVANALKLNPLLPGQMYPYPDRNGSVVVMLGPDGVFTLLSNHPDVVAQKDGGPAFWTEHGKDGDQDICTGYINHRTKGLLKKTIWVQEWQISSNPNWQTRRHHMSEIRALKQCARMVIHGLPVDPDEHRLGEMLNVTEPTPAPEPEKTPERPAAPPREAKGAATVAKNPPKKADPKIVEAEFTEAKKTDVEAELADDPKKAAEAEAKATPPPATEPPKTEPAKTARALLKPNEEIEVVCTVVEVTPTMLDLDRVNAPSVQVKLKGEYMGEALHHKGGTGDNNAVAPLPVWAVGSTVKVKLFGRQFKGGVRTMVLGVEAVAQPKGIVLE